MAAMEGQAPLQGQEGEPTNLPALPEAPVRHEYFGQVLFRSLPYLDLGSASAEGHGDPSGGEAS